MSTGNPSVDITSLRPSSQVILGCVKLTIKTKQDRLGDQNLKCRIKSINLEKIGTDIHPNLRSRVDKALCLFTKMRRGHIFFLSNRSPHTATAAGLM